MEFIPTFQRNPQYNELTFNERNNIQPANRYMNFVDDETLRQCVVDIFYHHKHGVWPTFCTIKDLRQWILTLPSGFDACHEPSLQEVANEVLMECARLWIRKENYDE